ncbi:MAG: replication-relaxation family protein [Sandaracinus sp.]
MSRARDLPAQARDGWAARQRPKLVKRDIAILYAIGRCKVLRTRDIARLFGSRATANDRLRKLFVAKLIDCHVPNLAGDNLYTLTERGRQVVAEATDGDASPTDRAPRALPQRLEHLAGINELRVLLTLATASPASPFA